MSIIDLTPIAHLALAVAGAVLAAFVKRYAPLFIAAFQTRTAAILTDQQRTAMLGAVKTAAGVLETAIDNGLLGVAHISVNSPAVAQQAQAAINAVPNAAAALGMTPDAVARMIVGAVDTGSRSASTKTITVAAAPPAPADTGLLANILPLMLSTYRDGVQHGSLIAAAVPAGNGNTVPKTEPPAIPQPPTTAQPVAEPSIVAA